MVFQCDTSNVLVMSTFPDSSLLSSYLQFYVKSHSLLTMLTAFDDRHLLAADHLP